MRKRELPVTSTDRLGSAAIGMFSGLAAGFIVWMLWLKTHETAPALAAFVFGGAGIGAALGFLAFDLIFGVAAAVLAMLVGFFGAASLFGGSGGVGGAARLPGLSPEFQRDQTPTWRRVLAWLCLAAGVAIFLLLRRR